MGCGEWNGEPCVVEDLRSLLWLDHPYPKCCQLSGMTRKSYELFYGNGGSWVVQLSLEGVGTVGFRGSLFPPLRLSTLSICLQQKGSCG